MLRRFFLLLMFLSAMGLVLAACGAPRGGRGGGSGGDDDDDSAADDDDASGDDDDASGDDDDASGDDDDTPADDDDTPVDDDDDTPADDDDTPVDDDDDTPADDDDDTPADDDDDDAGLGGTLISGLDFDDGSTSPFFDCENTYNLAPFGTPTPGCPGCNIVARVQFQALALGCPSNQLGDLSGGSVDLGVVVATNSLYLNHNQGDGWVPYAGNPGTTGSSTFTGNWYDDNGGTGYCFDMDGDQACDPGSDLATEETFILSW